ncbi:MAG: ATP-binding cassette domain-containing protein [Spirochaetales bacterium]|nr:ATP-binding cassette domain-containing protein [Spirochaetales bacterium]
MLSVSDVSLSFGKRLLFKDVNIKFTPGNCYGLIGANGSGKSTFLKILSGEQDYDSGQINIPSGMRMAVLAQKRDAFDEFSVLHAVIRGHEKLYAVMKEREELYSKADMTDEEGMRVGELEGEFAEMGGYEAESEAATLLAGLGIEDDLHDVLMADVEENTKVRVLIAQSLFGNPDILLLDEPTNHLDIESIRWLEEFLLKFNNTVIVVSHDRHFLNKVCTHIADIDYGKISIYVGNYSFWQQASQLMARQQKDQQKKAEARAAELKAFIQRFAANASKSKQATSRMKELDKLDLESMPRSSRRFPFCGFSPERELGKIVLEVEGLAKTLDGEKLFENWDFNVQAGDKIGFVGPNNPAKTAFMDIIAGEDQADSGSYNWGVTTKYDYFPKNNTPYFSNELSMTDWLRQFSVEQDEAYIRGFLGRMLFTQDESLKKVKVLSGGEKVRCLLSKMMLSGANVLILDDPTGHLDLESITSLNNGLMEFGGAIIFASHDHQFINTVANRIVEFTPGGVIDRRMTFEEYLVNEDVAALRDKMYGGHHERLRI